MKLEIYKVTDGEYSWRLFSKGREVARMPARILRAIRRSRKVELAFGIAIGVVATLAFTLSFTATHRAELNASELMVIKIRICKMIRTQVSPDTDGFYAANCKSL